MPPPLTKGCQCLTLHGCFVIIQREEAEDSWFVRLSVWGPQAHDLLQDLVAKVEAEAEARQEYPISGSGDIWRVSGRWWSAIVAWSSSEAEVRERTSTVKLRAPAWSMTDIARLRKTYATGGLAACLGVFREEGRTYHAVTCALRRYRIRDRGERPVLQEVCDA